MIKATVVLVVLAAFGLGALIGASLTGVDDANPDASGSVMTQAEVQPLLSGGGAPVFRYLAPGDIEAPEESFGPPDPAVTGENFIGREGEWRSETLRIELPGDGSVEYKALMQQGDAVVYGWTVSGGDVYYDFHAHDDAFGEVFFSRYAEGEGDSDAGSIVAPYSGQHGWYWLNLETEPVVITLKVAGFFEDIIRLEIDKT